MNPRSAPPHPEPAQTGELLILPDGRILVHNLTPLLARVLCELDPSDQLMRERATSGSPGQLALPAHFAGALTGAAPGVPAHE
jgi:hypothetical protein